MNTDGLKNGFYVGSWEVRPRRDCIRKDGRTVHLAPKAMAVLVCLARAQGSVVSRKQLFDSVWAGRAVTDDALTQRIAELRKAFGDNAFEPCYIQTIPKIGFRLAAETKPVCAEDASGFDTQKPSQPLHSIDRRSRRILPILTILMASIFGFLVYGKVGVENEPKMKAPASEEYELTMAATDPPGSFDTYQLILAGHPPQLGT